MPHAGDVEITGVEQQRAWRERVSPPVEQLAPDVWSVPVDCSEYAIRYTFCYILTGAQNDFVVLDPGLDTPKGRAQLLSAIATIGLRLEHLSAIVVSHFHADHLAMATWLSAASGAPVAMHERDAMTAARMTDATELARMDREWIAELGAPVEHLDSIALTTADAERFGGIAAPQARVGEGTLLALSGRSIRCVWTPGHTAGHVCLVDEDNGLLFAGDHVLPRITPNVGLTPYDPPDRDAVAEYAASLDRMRAWDGLEVCPAHEYRFRGLARRCDVLLRHQRERDAEVATVSAAEPGASTWDIARDLTWSRGWHELNGQSLRAALAETSAHMRHLAASRQPQR